MAAQQQSAEHYDRLRQHLAATWENETAITLRVMRAYPAD